MANEAKPCPCHIGDKLDYGGLGQDVQIDHIKAYVVKPSAPSDGAVIVIQDIFGWKLPNTRYMADMLAANGYTNAPALEINALYTQEWSFNYLTMISSAVVLVAQSSAVCPDFYVGKEPWDPSNDWAKFQEWLKDKKATEINKELDAVLRFLKEQCGAKHIGAVGFCWGGVAAHYLALQYPEVEAVVSFYGIIREREDKYELKVPTLFVFAEKDNVIPLDQVSLLEAQLKEKCTADYQVKVFPGQTHGFAHRKREDINPTDTPSILEARADMLNWLKKYMK